MSPPTPPPGSAAGKALATDRRFFDALVAADSSALDRLLHAEFLIVDVGAGDVTDRKTFIAFVGSGQVTFERIETFPDEAVVRELAGAVVVIGRTAMSVALPDGSAFAAGSRYTHVFVPDADTASGVDYVLASAQGTQIRSDGPSA